MQAKVIHAFRKWEEIQRDILELTKLRDRIAEDREYSHFLKESISAEIQKLKEQMETLLKLEVRMESAPSLPRNLPSRGKELYAEKESKYRQELAHPTSPPSETEKPKTKPERPVYKY